MSTVLVYSCVTGDYDKVHNSLLASIGQAEEDVRYVLYTDQVVNPDGSSRFRHSSSNIQWEIKPLVWQHPFCNRRTARWHKINSHLLPDKADITIWLDGSQRLKDVGIRDHVLDVLPKYFGLATFRHPQRVCAYQELDACIQLKKDNVALMQRQISNYRAEGYPPYNGLVETACVVRQSISAGSTRAATAFNQLWWDQVNTHSYRDQLSFNYVAWRLKQRYSVIPGCRAKSGFCDFVPHAS